MKCARVRKVRKVVRLYQIRYGWRTPCKVFCSPEFVRAASKARVLLRDSVSKLFGLEGTSAFYTDCVRLQLGSEAESLLKGLERTRCRHEGHSLSAVECLAQTVRAHAEEGRWATMCGVQALDEIKAVRAASPATLMVAFYNQVLFPLPPPHSSTSSSTSTRSSLFKIKTTTRNKSLPNPLSCMKKKKNNNIINSSSTTTVTCKKTRRGRRRSKTSAST